MDTTMLTKIWKEAARGDLPSLLSFGYAQAGCHLVLGDPILSVAADACGADTAGWKWEDFIAAGFAPAFTDGKLLAEEMRIHFSDTREGWLGTASGSSFSHLILDLHTQKGNRFHLSAASRDREVLEKQLTFLDPFSEALLVLLNRAETEEDRRLPLARLMSRLLEGNAAEEEWALSRARLMQFPTEGVFSLLCVDLSGFAPRRDSLATITNRLCRYGRNASVIHESHLVILYVFASEKEVENEAMNAGFREILKANGLTAARSRNFFNLWELYYYYQQALQMLKLKAFSPKSDLLDYMHLSLYLLADRLPETEKKESACHPIVRRLLALDTESHFGYLETLKAYLACSQKAQLACKMLHIHRNTLDYRLKKTEDQVPIDWTDGNLMQQLYFSIILLELLGRMPSGN